MSKNILPKSSRIHIRRQKASIRKQVSSRDDKQKEIETLYKKFVAYKEKLPKNTA